MSEQGSILARQSGRTGLVWLLEGPQPMSEAGPVTRSRSIFKCIMLIFVFVLGDLLSNTKAHLNRPNYNIWHL